LLGVFEFRRLVIVTGTPGVGKTDFSRMLAKRIGATHIDLGKFAETQKSIAAFDRKRRSRIVDLRRMSAEFRKLLSAVRGTIVVDGHYAVDVVPTNLVRMVFVLRCDPEKLERRLRQRGFPEAKIRENVTAEILDICLWDSIESCKRSRVSELNTTDMSKQEILAEALKVLEGKKPPLIGVVDWLGSLEEKGKLNNFLSYAARTSRRFALAQKERSSRTRRKMEVS